MADPARIILRERKFFILYSVDGENAFVNEGLPGGAFESGFPFPQLRIIASAAQG